MRVLDLPVCGGEHGHRNRAPGLAGEELLVQLVESVVRLARTSTRVAASMPRNFCAAKRERYVPERWWMAPIKGTLRACTPSGRRRRGHQER
jgi:hypothetical protein